MFTGSLCLSGNNGSRQDRYVDTKTQQIKDDLKVFLHGVLEGTIKLGEARGIYKFWLKKHLYEKKKIDRSFIQFLYDLLCIDQIPIPDSQNLEKLYKHFIFFQNLGLSPLEVLNAFADLGILEYDSIKQWNYVYSFLENLYKHFSDRPVELFERYNLIISNLKLFSVEKELLQYLNSNNILCTVDFALCINTNNAESNNYLLKIAHSILRYAFKTKDIHKHKIVQKILSLETDNNENDYFKPDLMEEKLAIIDYLVCSAWNIDDNLKSIKNFLVVNQYNNKIVLLNHVISLGIAHKTNLVLLINFFLEDKTDIKDEYMADYIEMINALYILDDFFSEFNYYELDDLFHIIRLYSSNKDYAIHSLEEIDRLLPEKGLKFELDRFNKKLLAFLFFHYEKPWILINNFNPIDHLDVMDFLIKGNRIDAYTDLPIALNNKEANAFYMNFGKNDALSCGFEESIYLAKLSHKGISNRILTEIGWRGQLIENYELWERVTPFFVRFGREIEYNGLVDIIDFLNENADFNIKGRTYKSMMRIVNQWHEELRLKEYSQQEFDRTWDRIGLPDYIYSNDYKIIQLTKGKDLILEGFQQYHCVSTYMEDCISGYCSIWSLRKRQNEYKYNPLITIELRNNTIAQARGKYNRLPTEGEMNIIKHWANKCNLIIRL